MNSEFLVLGKIVGVWGVKGWLKVFSYTRQRDDIASYDHWYLRPKKSLATKNPSSVLYRVKNCRTQGQGLVAQLDSVDSRDQAEALNGYEVLVKADQLPTLGKGEYYWHQLIGLTVVRSVGGAEDFQELGKVRSMIETGANDVIVVRSDNAGEDEEVLIPYIQDDVIKSVDIENGQLVVDWVPDY